MSRLPLAGEKAPDFELVNQYGRDVRLHDFHAKKNVVLYFYPKDDTPGCTREACNFRDQILNFDRLETQIIGVSVDNIASHKNFSEKYELPFQLLSDEQKSVSKSYGVLNEKGYCSRVTFVIDKEGIITEVFPEVKVEHHWEEIRQALEALKARV